MVVTLVNTNTVSRLEDPMTTGIPYMPITLAYVAASLREGGFDVRVIDAFGEDPTRGRVAGAFLIQGLTPEDVARSVARDSAAIFVYAGTVAAHIATVDHVCALRAATQCPIVILENTQAVTSYRLRPVAREFFAAGADFVLEGEAEARVSVLVRAFASNSDWRGIAGILYNRDGVVTSTADPPSGADLDNLPLPAWDLFPIEKYWRLRYAHGPMETAYLPLLTSRGCPYPCRFCVIPELSGLRWRARSAGKVVDEIESHVSRFGVREFHIEDLNPTVNAQRIRELAQELLSRNVGIVWKIAAGTKIDAIKDVGLIELMARSGCRYLSLSPESGSPRVLKLMAKPFAHAHALDLVREMERVGIKTQACFVIGFPGEDEADRRLTRGYVRDLVRAGLDEIALFIMTPVPGSSTYGQLDGFQSLSELNFSPRWRVDFKTLNRFRLQLYASFLYWKLRYRPAKVLRQCLNFARRRFETKMEMTPYRAMHLITLRWRSARPFVAVRERAA